MLIHPPVGLPKPGGKNTSLIDPARVVTEGSPSKCAPGVNLLQASSETSLGSSINQPGKVELAWMSDFHLLLRRDIHAATLWIQQGTCLEVPCIVGTEIPRQKEALIK